MRCAGLYRPSKLPDLSVTLWTRCDVSYTLKKAPLRRVIMTQVGRLSGPMKSRASCQTEAITAGEVALIRH